MFVIDFILAFLSATLSKLLQTFDFTFYRRGLTGPLFEIQLQSRVFANPDQLFWLNLLLI